MRLPPTSASPGPVSSTGLAEFQDADLEASIPARFATLVAQLPAEHLAYHGADAELTYRQLDRLSDAWAAKLVALLGRGRPGAQAAIITLLPHGGLSLIGLLAVLKAGHFYVPLEINQGDDYAARIIADCAPQATLTTGELLAQAQRWMSVAEPASLLTIDAEPPTLEPGFVSADSFSQMIASVLYTSGSTGWPRGVIRTHRQNLFSAYVNAREGGYNPEARVAHLISYAFSFSVPVIFGALLTGATLVGPPAMSMLPSELYGWLRAHEISVFQCAPSVLRELSAVAGDFPPLTSLTAIATGMEPVSREVIQRLSRLLPAGCLLMFRLASTEAGLVTHFSMHVGDTWEGDWTPAGYPPVYTEVFIGDDAGQPIPRGEPGQICVRSRFLSAGYWNLPDETAARFLPDPDGGDRRIFLTGDWGRMDADGMLHHLGRMDFMVKVRGYRVEPEMIELALLAHSNLRECVVAARQSRAGDNQLVAYLVAREQPAPSVAELRGLLAQKLPDFMIPSRFVWLDALPRTANGKVDRQALPPPGKGRPDLDTPFMDPRSELEQQLAGIWADLLELDEVGVEDDFFALGGDSLAALRMALTVEEATGQRVPTDFMSVPTVAHLAGTLLRGPAASQAVTGDAGSPSPMIASTKPTRSLRDKLRAQVLEDGPLWHGHGLPYGVGVRWQRWLIAQPWVRRRYARQLALVERWSAELSILDSGRERATISLLANTWLGWRKAALSRVTDLSDWVTVNDPYQILLGTSPFPTGAVLAVSHAGRIGLLPLEICRRNGRETGSIIGGEPVGPLLRSEMLLKAERILQRGGVVMVAADGLQGHYAVDVPFWGRRRSFQMGAAELAVTTGSALVPVYITFDARGRIHLEVTAPLETKALTTRDRIRELTERYGADYVARWPQFYASMLWRHLAHNLDLSPW